MLDLKEMSYNLRRLDRPISVQTDTQMLSILRHYEELESQQSKVDFSVEENQIALL